MLEGVVEGEVEGAHEVGQADGGGAATTRVAMD